MFRNDYEIELENIISKALSLIESDKIEECKQFLEKENDKINQEYENNFK